MIAKESGVPLAELRAALELIRLHQVEAAVSWPADIWERVWVALTGTQQRVVYLHIFRGHTHTEVAVLLGVGRGSVDGAWRRALARIRDALVP